MRLAYLVQQSEWTDSSGREDGFDFGGINGGVASFMAKGDAILFAQELRRRCPDLAVRVLATHQRRSPEVFRIGDMIPA